MVTVWEKPSGELSFTNFYEVTVHHTPLRGVPGGWNEINPADVPERV